MVGSQAAVFYMHNQLTLVVLNVEREYSELFRPPDPAHSGHPFRFYPATHSEHSGHP
jgi:hypothetical protein